MKLGHLQRGADCVRSFAVIRRCAHARFRARAADWGLRAKTGCSCEPGLPTTVPQGDGGAPVLRPTLAGQPCGPRRSAASSPSKRATSQDTANGASARGHHHRPVQRSLAWHLFACHLGCRGRWLGVRSEAPFAVSWLFARLAGVECAALRRPHRVPRERGPENVPRATCPRAGVGMRAAANGHFGPKTTVHTESKFMRRGSRETRWGN